MFVHLLWNNQPINWSSWHKFSHLYFIKKIKTLIFLLVYWLNYIVIKSIGTVKWWTLRILQSKPPANSIPTDFNSLDVVFGRKIHLFWSIKTRLLSNTRYWLIYNLRFLYIRSHFNSQWFQFLRCLSFKILLSNTRYYKI